MALDQAAGHGQAREAGWLPLPATATPLRVEWPFANGIIFYHLVALLAFVPALFSWAGVGAAILGYFLFGMLGINVGYHRLLTHKGFTCPRWLEYAFAMLGVCCLQGSPAHWVAIHRRHHQFADRQQDPHSPLVNLAWGHVGWILFKNAGLPRTAMSDPYARDLIRQPFYRWIETHWRWLWIAILSWPLFFFAGFAASLLADETLGQAALFGASLLVWGVFLRTVLHWHLTWAVNSVAHRWGYRNYETPDDSRNNIPIGLLACGEGWHNNHHADPRSARHGHKWWEFDLAWLVIRAFAVAGLARDLARPRPASTRPAADGEGVPG